MSNPGSRYVRLLQQTKGQNLNNGTVAGGLAHALTQGLRGYASRKADEEEQEKARQREQQIAGYLTGVNQRAMGNDGPTQEAAARAPIPDPEGLAGMLADKNMAPFGMADYGRMMAPAPERYEDVLDEQGRVIGQRSSVSDRLAPVPANPYAPKPPPAGWQMGDDGRMAPIPGGPADPAYIDRTRAPKEQQQSPLARMINEYNALPADDPNRPFYASALDKMTSKTGTSLSIDADGNISFSQGAQGPDIAKPTMNKVEEGLLNTSAAMQRITNIRNSFDPSFLKYSTQVDNWLTAVQDKTFGGVSDEAQERLSAYTRYALDTKENLNRTIQELTGAAMGVDEAKRIKATVPNASDSPQEFRVKLDRITEKMRFVMARLNYIRANGLKREDVPLGDMRGIMSQRADQLIKELRTPGISDEALEAKVHSRLRDEFGLTGAQ